MIRENRKKNPNYEIATGDCKKEVINEDLDATENEDKTSVEEDNEQEKEVFGFLVSVPRSDFNKC